MGRAVALAGAVAVAAWLAAAAAEAPLRLSLPIECEPGRTCFVQSYVDLDPGPGQFDHACGEATYDGHTGTDFRLLSAATARSGIRVVAAAPGRVVGARDGMADAFPSAAVAAIAGRECGNGVVVDHGGGWETQYCHLRRGSIRVKAGDRVDRGSHLGDVGWSGLADFAHVHFEVRREGRPVDPFSGHGQDGACLLERGTAAGLWDEVAVRTLPYRAGELIDAGFAASIVSTRQLEHGGEAVARPVAGSDELLFYARLINGKAGDRVRMTVTGPEGFQVAAISEALERRKAVWVSFAGRKRRAPRWPPGRYEGRAELLRAGAVVSTATAALEMD